MGTMFQKILSAVPGIKQDGNSRFFYPSDGFGKISSCYYKAADNDGAKFYFNARIKSIQISGNSVLKVCCELNGSVMTFRPDYVWSTIPVTSLVQYLQPSPPALIMQASKKIKYRGMILVYLVLEQERFSEYDTHYFPEHDIPITRISEPRNYRNNSESQKSTVLCAELPCFTTDIEWYMTDKELGEVVGKCLESATIPIKVPVKEIVTRRLLHAYPIYRLDHEMYFDQIDKWLGQIENLIFFGRQGLFVHDNTHHTLYMAYAAVKCLDRNGYFDWARWQSFRQIFNAHVVED
jgi:protoporphyrinogen oxidase